MRRAAVSFLTPHTTNKNSQIAPCIPSIIRLFYSSSSFGKKERQKIPSPNINKLAKEFVNGVPSRLLVDD
jgi:hypothetical protein